MKKLFNFLKKCVIVAMICLVISNIIIPSPNDFDPESGIAACEASSNPDKDPFDPSNY